MKDAEDYNFKYNYEKSDPSEEEEVPEINENMINIEGNVIRE